MDRNDFDNFYAYISIGFHSVGEDNKVLDNQRFQLVRADGKETGIFIEANEKNLYNLDLFSEYPDNKSR